MGSCHCCTASLAPFSCAGRRQYSWKREQPMKWIGPQIFELAIIFAIDICAYALLLMSRESSFADGLESGCRYNDKRVR